MNDVNLNGSGLKLVTAGGQASARAGASPQNEGSNAPAQVAGSGSPAGVVQVSRVQDASESANAKGRSAEHLDQAVSRLNDYVQSVRRDLQFEVDNDLGETIVRVVDQETQEVIRQIPDEVALRLAEKLQQDEPLTLFNIEV
ncbi:flagellar protein FlaG [Marinobacter salinexigens]|uniref:Flagellar protein FlaG n=1 Tax=Marinobacter salinexigens TaxID=2919747 RepID=A0A5B0VL71_9GAMM|nr:flagellar protein FlaG [Marinobacter salinexigens]KAA1174729.1 flagellar protein FlaG [Marinobacter salinexigens]